MAKHLTERDRGALELALALGLPITEIASRLHKHRSTIYREIKKGLDESHKSYDAGVASTTTEALGKIRGNKRKLARYSEDLDILESIMLERKWSCAATVAWAKASGVVTKTICAQTFYSYIYAQHSRIKLKQLPKGRYHKKQKAKQYKVGKKPSPGTSIDERPTEVEAREVFGHWEGDLILGKQGTKTVYLTLVERKTRYVIVKRLNRKRAKDVVSAINALEREYGRMFSEVFKSITFDNGTEFSYFKELETSQFASRQDKPRTKIYYAHPYRSQERGSNENCNGLLRRAGFTKGTNLGLISKKRAKEAVDWVNALPRKILGYISAQEAFFDELKKIYVMRC